MDDQILTALWTAHATQVGCDLPLLRAVWEHARVWERERIASLCDAAAEAQDWESARTAIEDLASTIRKGEWRAL
jgi:hypothetical protein